MKLIRSDLDGTVTVHVAGVATQLHAGDRVPRGVEVDDALLEDYDESDAPSPAPEPLTESERNRGLELGIADTEIGELPAEWVRGFLEGYAAGSTAAIADEVGAAVGGPDDSGDGAQATDRGVTVHGKAGDELTEDGSGTDYDPGAEGVTVDDVLAELEKRTDPAERRAIIYREEQGKGRAGILQSKFADEAKAPPTS